MRLRDESQLGAPAYFVRELDPGAFAFVMATGIVSTALLVNDVVIVSDILLFIGLAGYAVLLIATVGRALRWPRRMHEDFVSPQGFAYLAFVAGTNMLATHLALVGYTVPATVLLAIGVIGWLLLGYGVPLALITGRHHDRGLRFVSGLWFLWVVAIQSVAVAASALAPRAQFLGLPVLASVCWAIGLVLYPVIATLVLARLLLRSVTPAELIPAYWVFMGACAITVLAGAKLLNMPGDTVLPESVILGMSFVQWAFCTWLLPLLIGLGVWRHVIRRYPLRYETGMWGMVFPIGMYGVASHRLGAAGEAPWLAAFGGGEGWIAAAVWAAVFLGMLKAFHQTMRRNTPEQPLQPHDSGRPPCSAQGDQE